MNGTKALNNYMASHPSYNDFLAHHGIKGQKWGVRRYQNPDGSLTEAGRKRYGTGDSKRDMNKLSESYAMANAEKVLKEYEDWKDKLQSNVLKRNPELAKEREKWADPDAWWDHVKQSDALTKEERAKDNKLQDKLIDASHKLNAAPTKAEADYERIYIKNDKIVSSVDKDYWAPSDTDTKSSVEAADLGLKALRKIGRDSYDDKTGITDADREWFLYEDQTIGLPTAAHLINKGHSAADVKKFYSAINTMYRVGRSHGADMDKLWSKYFDVMASGFDYDPLQIRKFIDACESIKKQRK